jgi:hypothetical protein
MDTLEIVHLRSSGEPIETLGERIRESIEAEGTDTEIVTLYRRHGLETDVAIHLRHLQPRKSNGPRTLALRLAHALREFGLVEHTVWEEMTAEG